MHSSRMTVLRVTLEAFHERRQRLPFAQETGALIAAIRSSPPGRPHVTQPAPLLRGLEVPGASTRSQVHTSDKA
jgi:Flp pilus assembly protein CpaB